MKKFILFLLTVSIVFVGCSDDDDNTPAASNITLNIEGFEALGDNFDYEGWLIVDGNPVSTGVFDVDANGELSETVFEVSAADKDAATMFVVSIEPVPDNDPAPAPTKYVSGAFNGNTASIGTGTIGAGFESSTGKYIIAAPTGTMAPEEEFSGIWFLDNSGTDAVAGLDLPSLNPGWKYEGWVVIDGTPVTTGTFTNVNSADEASPFSDGGPNYPGEDFLMNAPTGLAFPTDLRGQTVVISIEPSPDNSPAPFTLKPLADGIPMTLSGNPYSIANNTVASFPTGSVSR